MSKMREAFGEWVYENWNIIAISKENREFLMRRSVYYPGEYAANDIGYCWTGWKAAWECLNGKKEEEKE